MACNCLDKNRKNTIDATKGTEKEVTAVYYDLANIATWNEAGTKKIADNQTGQRIEVYYNYKDKKGNPKQGKQKSFYTHIYCPFCGVKYIED